METHNRCTRVEWALHWARRGLAAVAEPERILAGVATFAFPPAVLAPFFTFSPSLGDLLLDAAYEYADPGSMDPKTYSVVGGIALLFTEGDIVVALVLSLFSVLFPAGKLVLLWQILARPKPANQHWIRRLETLGPWSMADVFVVSVMLIAFKSFPGGTTFKVEMGYYFFLVSVVTSLIATWIVRHKVT